MPTQNSAPEQAGYSSTGHTEAEANAPPQIRPTVSSAQQVGANPSLAHWLPPRTPTSDNADAGPHFCMVWAVTP